MSLAVRVIPSILHKNGQLIKGRGFKADRVVGSALQAARIHESRQVDELVIFDVGQPEKPNFEFIGRLTESCFMPITYGGGVKSIKHIQQLLNFGADKVSFGHLELIEEAAQHFGNQAVVACMDVKYGLVDGVDPVAYAKQAEYLGAGEIILQCVERDGVMVGYDLRLIRIVAEAVSIPVIASGGCKSYEDMHNAIKSGASGVAVGALFLFSECTPKGAVRYLSEKGVEVRV